MLTCLRDAAGAPEDFGFRNMDWSVARMSADKLAADLHIDDDHEGVLHAEFSFIVASHTSNCSNVNTHKKGKL
ncbi:MAG: hypothetical protein ACRD7E_20540 [Bryobacteraceae bacterium]